MLQYFVPVLLTVIFFSILYSLYKSKGGKYKRHKQITAAIIGAI